jgi:hypothetical protein
MITAKIAGRDGAECVLKPQSGLALQRVQRAPEASVDMGTGYDCSDNKAHTAATSITPAQRQ